MNGARRDEAHDDATGGARVDGEHDTNDHTNDHETFDDETFDDDIDESTAPVRFPSDPEAQMIHRARERYGSLGVFVAGGMLGIDKMLGRRVKEEAPVVWEASGEPGDIDSHGIVVPIDETTEAVSKPVKVRRTVRKRRSGDSA